MKNTAAKKAIASYYALSLLITLPFLIPLWLIGNPLLVLAYFLCFLVYLRIATGVAIRLTVMAPLFKDLDAERYAATIHANPLFVNYSFKLYLYFAVGDYGAAYNVISSVLLPHSRAQKRIYGHLLLCRICFERGDYEGLREQLGSIEGYKQRQKKRLPRQYREAYDFYRAFSSADYEAACALLEKSIEKTSRKKSGAYITLMRRYQLAVTRRMQGEINEAVALFEQIQSSAPTLVSAVLAKKQLDYISGTVEETVPERLTVTEKYTERPYRKVVKAAVLCLAALALAGIVIFFILFGVIFVQLGTPRQENKDPAYIAQIENALDADYEECVILGYFNIYADYEEETYTENIDSLCLIKADGRLDLHSMYQSKGECQNALRLENIQVDTPYEYQAYFSLQRVEFVLTEKERDFPDEMLYYYEIDGYYFCVISISDALY